MTKRDDEAAMSESNDNGSSAGGDGDEVCGVKMEHVDHARLLKYATTMKLPLTKAQKEDPEALVEAVTTHITAKMKGIQMAKCDRCEAISPETLEFCPFCGEVGGEDEGDAESSVIGGNSSADPPSVMARAQKTETALATRVGTSALVKKADPPPLKELGPGSEDDLEEAVGVIQSLKRNWEQNAWDLGQKFIEIITETPNRPALWKLRKEQDGVTQAYKTFKEFLRAETGISYDMAMSCVYVAREFTREQVTMQPSSKIKIVLNAPETDRKRLLEIAEGTPVRELRKKVKDLNIAQGKKLKEKGVKQLALLDAKHEKGKIDDKAYEKEKARIQKETKDPTEKRRQAREERAKIENKAKDDAKGVRTVVLPWQKAKIALFRESKDAHGKLVPAHSVSDAWGWIEGKNGVFLKFKLAKKPTGHLQMLFDATHDGIE